MQMIRSQFLFHRACLETTATQATIIEVFISFYAVHIYDLS